MATESCKQELRDAIGPDKVRDDEISLTIYASDITPGLFQKPDIVVFPESTEDVRKVLPIANKYRVPVTVMSAGLNIAALAVPVEHGMVLDLRRMNKIIEINTDSGYAVVQPGVTFYEFSAELSKVQHRCHISTAPPAASVVANYLVRSSGTFVTKHLDPMIDLEVVFPDGSVTTTGSSHFPGSGPHLRYGSGPDVTGMFCLGHGTLGIVTKAAVRISPISESNRLAFATFDSYEASVRFTKDLVANNIAEHCIIYSWRMWLDGYAKGATSWNKPPKGTPYNAVTVRLAGYEETLAANERVIERVAERYEGKLHSETEAAKMMLYYPDLQSWYFDSKPVEITPASLKKLSSIHRPGEEVDEIGQYLFSWIVMAPPKSVVEVEKWGLERIQQLGCGVPAYYSQPFDFGRSIFLRLFIYPDANNKELVLKVAKTFTQMWDEALERYGATPFRARAFGAAPWLHNTGEFRSFLKKIKAAVDPNNILNPHMLG